MEIPPRFGSDLATKKLCKLKKALYRLKQSPRAWFGRFSKVMKKHGVETKSRRSYIVHQAFEFRGSYNLFDICRRHQHNGKEKQTLRQCLTKEFEIKELRRLKCFLRIEVARSKQGIFISQQKYVTNLLKETEKLVCKSTNTLIDPLIISLERLRKILW